MPVKGKISDRSCVMSVSKPTRLIETMRAEEGEIALLHNHLERLRESAEALGFKCPVETVHTRLRQKLVTVAEDVVRVRLVLEASGAFDISWRTLGDSLFETAALYPFAIEQAGTLVCTHKTTTRGHYDQARQWAAANGADEAILINPDGEIFDASRSTVWVEEEGMWFTPPLEAGGLPGVMRQHLLSEKDNAREKFLYPNDLMSDVGVYLSNAVRGLMRVQLV